MRYRTVSFYDIKVGQWVYVLLGKNGGEACRCRRAYTQYDKAVWMSYFYGEPHHWLSSGNSPVEAMEQVVKRR